MTLELYSTFLTLGVLAIGAAIFACGVGYALFERVRAALDAVDYFTYMKAIGALAIIATLGALTYQFYYETPVCELCWWQRIFLFPIDVIALVSIMYMVRVNHIIVGILATIGAAFASYHYYYHFQILVLGKTLSLPCSGYGLLPACTSSPILTFGFVTIPLMGLIVFLALIFLSFLAQRANTTRLTNKTQ